MGALTAAVAVSATVTLWRCTVCGKWSHAKRKPTRHQRFVVTGRTVVGWAGEPVYGPDGEFQPCGPFEEWTATRTPEVR